MATAALPMPKVPTGFCCPEEEVLPGVIPVKREELYDTLGTRVFLEQPADARTQFKLLAKQ